MVPVPKRTVLILAGCLLLLVAVALWADDGEGATRREVKTQICQVFGSRCGSALEVAWCESRLRPWAVSSGLDVGLFQINYASHHWPSESFAAFRVRMSQPGHNIRFAFRLSKQGTNWGHWVCKP
jgi:Lysozyme like domain